MIPALHSQVLTQVVTALRSVPIDWVVTGSTGMALQGLPLEPHDLDLQTSRDGAYAIEHALATHASTPVRFCENERIRSHMGVLFVSGLAVEIMGDLQKRLPDGRWEEPIRVTDHRCWVELGELRIPVLSLEYEYSAYLTLGRTDRAELLHRFLHK